MKTSLTLVILWLLSISALDAQQPIKPNDFRIGMFHFGITENPAYTYADTNYAPVTSNLFQMHPSSHLNVLHDDGFNVVTNYTPNGYWCSYTFMKALLDLCIANDMMFHSDARHFFKPNSECTDGINVYDQTANPNQNWQPRPNFQKLFALYSSQTYSNVVWGHHVTEEASYNHPYNPTTDVPVDVEKCNMEVPPTNVSDAIQYFRQIASPSQQLVVMEALHGRAMWEDVVEQTGPWDSPNNYYCTDYLKDLNSMPDVFFEGSYYRFPQGWWETQLYSNMNSTDIYAARHYLGGFASIDWAHTHINDVHKVICISRDEDVNGDQFHSQPQIENANWLWFQAYTSIIHGVKGIWFWDLATSYKNCEKAQILTDPNMNTGISESTIIARARLLCPTLVDVPTANIHCGSTAQITCGNSTTIGEIYNEAVEKIWKERADRFESSFFPSGYNDYVRYLSRELAYLSGKDLISTDFNTIIASKTDENDDPNWVVPPITDQTNYIIHSSIPLEKRTKEYSLRYTIRSNGNETIMIVSNPLNVPVTVTLDFDNLANPIVQNSIGVEVLFVEDKPIYQIVNSLSYKEMRNSNINLNDPLNSPDATDLIPYTSSNDKSITLSFGPMDVHVLKFVTGNMPNYENDWTNVWSNFGSGNLDGHTIGDNDLFYFGDFDGDGAEEILICQYNQTSSGDWITMLDFVNGDWEWAWSNQGSSAVSIYSYRDKLVVGDFDGDGIDDLFGYHSTGEIKMFKFVNNSWVQGWTDAIYKNHPIRTYRDVIYSGDYNGDGRDELFACNLLNNYSAVFSFSTGTNNFVKTWYNNGNHAINDYLSNMKKGDFDGDGKDELLGLSTSGTVFHFDINNWGLGYSTNGSGSFGGWTYPLSLTDQVVSGNLDVDNKDELFFIQAGSNSSWATTMDLKADQSDWNWNWSANPNYSVPFIDDWSLQPNNGTNTQYFLVKPIANQPKNLLAIRKFHNTYLVNMYKPFGLSNKSSLEINKIEDSIEVLSTVSVFPNPSDGVLNLNSSGSKINSIILYNEFGTQIESWSNEDRSSIVLHLEELPAGIYFLKIDCADSSSVRKRVIIN